MKSRPKALIMRKYNALDAAATARNVARARSFERTSIGNGSLAARRNIATSAVR
jgi:hypothetical protein